MLTVIYHSILKTIFAYFLLLLLARLMGRKMLSQMTFFDFIVGVTVGAVTANLALTSKYTSVSAATVLVILTVLTLLVDFTRIKNFLFGKIVNSEPVALIENGKINDKNMNKIRFTVSDLMAQLRQKNVFNLADVEFAIIETDGILSVLPKSQKQPLTPSDLNIPTSYRGLTKDLVVDGNIMYENLKSANLDEQWLINQLKGFGITDVRGEVFYTGLDTSGNLYVSKRTHASEKHGQYGIE